MKPIHNLGTLYARYGLYDKALREFERVLKLGEYYKALYNLGNIYYLKNDMDKSLQYYKRAERIAPDNPAILLGIARVHYELANFEDVNLAYNKVKVLAPEIASQYAYLASETAGLGRASSANNRKGAIWEE
jgi:tetratricopeptide (TPR) repeat protein